MIHGPGCPVCVLPIGRMDLAIELALEHDVMLCTYGDTMRVPASDSLSLTKAKARGADIRMVYSAGRCPATGPCQPRARKWCFLPLGLRPPRRPRRSCMRDAAREGDQLQRDVLPRAHATRHHAPFWSRAEAHEMGAVPIDGFVGPAHVSIIIGSDPYAKFATEYQKPVVIAGFEPLDVLQAILMLVRQVNEGPRRGRKRVHPRRHAHRQPATHRR
jgi:hydrogenase expression/formation protein HypD